MPSSRDLPDPGIKPRSPALQADSLPSEPSGKPMNTGVGSLSLLQGIFSTQGLNPPLLNWLTDSLPLSNLEKSCLHCRLTDYRCMGYFWAFSPASLICFSVLALVQHYFDGCSLQDGLIPPAPFFSR